MLDIIATLIVGIAFALFATQNTVATGVNFGFMSFSSVPVYLVVLGGILFGVLLSSIISFFNYLANTFRMHGKNVEIENKNQKLQALEERIHNLETENDRLKKEVTTEKPKVSPHPLRA